MMAQLVPDEDSDAGPVLAQKIILIQADAALQSLEVRVRAVAHYGLAATLKTLLQKG